MGIYRLEIWFNAQQNSIDWGVAEATGGGNTPFQNGGNPLAKNNGVVTITGAGNRSTFDIYVFDVTGDGVARQMQTIEIDYERAAGGPNQGRDPISWGDSLRAGMTGAQFNGDANGYTAGVGQEDTVFCAPGLTAQRRWSMASGYQGVMPGHYTFDASIVMTPPNPGQVFSFDPEMDINT
jgi:hypothetical protein